MLTPSDLAIRAHGTGKTRADAFQAAVREMRENVMQQHKESAILQMEPENCRVIRAIEHTRTERFFGVLFPRTTSTYELELEFTVRMKVVDLTTISFARSHEDLSPAQHLLQMR